MELFVTGAIKITENHFININKMKDKLLKIQKQIGAIKKDSINPHFKNKYFDINTLLEAVKPVLNNHGVVLLQGLVDINGQLALRTQLIDSESVEVVEATCPLPVCLDAQKYGSAISYFRRYAIVSLLALEAEDDDANTIISKPGIDRGYKYPENINNDEPPF